MVSTHNNLQGAGTFLLAHHVELRWPELRDGPRAPCYLYTEICRCVAAAIYVMTVIAVSYTVIKATGYVKFFMSCIFGTDFDAHTHMRFV